MSRSPLAKAAAIGSVWAHDEFNFLEAYQGCTPGYWKNRNHLDSWVPAGYNPSSQVQSVFGSASAYSAEGSASLLEALKFGGGVESRAESVSYCEPRWRLCSMLPILT